MISSFHCLSGVRQQGHSGRLSATGYTPLVQRDRLLSRSFEIVPLSFPSIAGRVRIGPLQDLMASDGVSEYIKCCGYRPDVKLCFVILSLLFL